MNVSALPSPTIVQVSVVTPAGRGLRSSETVELLPPTDGATGDVNVVRDIRDPYEDEAPASYRPPADPRRWHATPDATGTPAIRDAVAGVRSALESVDWSQVQKQAPTAKDAEHVQVSMLFAQRPVGMDHLRPVQVGPNGEWFVGVRSSLDLFASPQLAPLVDATRAVVDLARAVSKPIDHAWTDAGR